MAFGLFSRSTLVVILLTAIAVSWMVWFFARSGSSPPATRPSSAWTSVPLAWPAPGCTTRPAGLSTTRRCSSS
ncbi:MAG: hypothetical protein ACJ74S_14800 [Gaiellaceae bacterium]